MRFGVKVPKSGRFCWLAVTQLPATAGNGTEGACAPTCSTSTCRPTASRCGRQARATRRDCWWSSRAGAPELEDRKIADLPDLLQPGDCLVVNDSKVIAARLTGRRIGRGEAEPEIEATLHKRIDGSHWRAFILGAKKVQVGDTLRFGTEGKVCFLGELDAQVSQKDEGGEVTLSFSFHGPVLDQAIAERGAMPLPPYIASRRAPDEQDRDDYQTLFARDDGSVAAPTAGLHFTEGLLARLEGARRRPSTR